jgi:Fusaric acid resistance protein family
VTTIPDRLLGWAIAGGVSLFAVVFILPSPSLDPLVAVTSKAMDNVANYLGARTPLEAGESSVTSEPAAASTALRTTFFAAPFRPAGLSVSSRLLIKVIEWTLELDTLLAGYGSWSDENDTADTSALTRACASVLSAAAAVLVSGDDATPLETSLAALRESRSKLEESSLRSLHRRPPAVDAVTPDAHDVELVAVLDESFRADDIADTVEKLGDDMVELVNSRHRTWWQQSLGLEAKGSDSRLGAARRRLGSHFSRRSVWLHNSARGAIGLGISVWVAYGFGVQHAFWVVFGTLAVLRSNALSTGQTAVKALTGTVEGIIIGSIIIALLGSHETVFWILLPFAICFTGFAPSAISFAAGQAGFTMTILILFNIVEPIGWKIGVIRIEDVGLGCAVSLVVGLLFWPRGASATLRYSIADAITESVNYLRATVVFALACCDKETHQSEDPLEARRVAQAAARRLDDAFREYLSERGSKSASLADVSSLIAGVTAVRTTADSIHSLWTKHDLHASDDRTVVREALTQGVESVSRWYAQLADVVTGSHQMPSAPADFDVSVQELVDTVRRDLSDEAGHATAAAFKIVWTDDYLRQLHRLQERLLPVVENIAATSAPSTRRRVAPLRSGSA